MTTDIALIKNMIDMNHKSLRMTIDKMEKTYEDHDTTLYGRGNHEGQVAKVSRALALTEKLKTHASYDRWIQGTLITLILILFGAVFHK